MPKGGLGSMVERGRVLSRHARTVNRTLFVGLVVYAIARGAESGVDLHAGSVGAQVGDLLGFASLCGLLAYATVELVKRLTGLRAAVNSAVVAGWFEDQYVALRNEYRDELEQVDFDAQREATHRLRVPRFPWAQDALPPIGMLLAALGTQDLTVMFDLPPERLVAQISTAIDVALYQPERYGSLLAVVARLPYQPEPTANQETELLGSHEAQYLRLALDDLQTMLTQRWRQIVQSAAVWVAGAYGVATTFAGGLSGTNQARYLLAALVLGGPIAWAIRDLTAVLGRLRQ
jgi:hypothetical protein